MKKIFNKAFFIFLLCSMMMPSVVQAVSFRSPIYYEKPDFGALFNILYNLSRDNKLLFPVGENTARKIFESKNVQRYMPGLFFSWSKIKFMKNLVEYCKDRFMKEVTGNRKTLYEYSIILSMSATYLGYLEKPWVSKREVLIAGAAVALRSLKLDLRILAVFSSLSKSVLKRLASGVTDISKVPN